MHPLPAPLLSLLLVAAGAHSSFGAVAPHPRLILNPERVAALQAADDTTHRELWQAVLQSAEQLERESIPVMKEAGNSYISLGDRMPVFGLAFRMTGERRYAEAADRWLQALLAVPEWKGTANLGRSAWVVATALLYDWLHDALPEQTRARIRERLLKEGEILLREHNYWRLLSNHCLLEVSALGMIGLALQGEVERADAFLERARERTELIIEHAPLDGSWGEGIQYWQIGLGYLIRYLEAPKTAGDRDYYPRYAWLEQTGFFPIHFSLPGRPADPVNFADTAWSEIPGFLMYLPASVYRNGYYQDYAKKMRSVKPYRFSWLDFITYDPTVTPVDIATLPTFAHFSDNGFVMMRSGWDPAAALIGFHCGPGPGHRNQADPRRLERNGFGPGHAHPDINSFCLFAHGTWLAINPGYVYEKWTRQHTTILVNGLGQAGGEGNQWLDYMAFQNREPAPAILRAETHPEFDYVIGDAGNVYVEEAGLGHFRRHLLFLKPDIVVVLDDLEARKPARFEWLLQAHEQAAQTGPNEFEIVREGVRLWVRHLRPAGYDRHIGSRPLKGSTDARAPKRTIATLNFAVESAERSSFLVVLCALPGADAPTPDVELRNGYLRIVHQGKSWDIAVKDPVSSADPAARLMHPRQR